MDFWRSGGKSRRGILRVTTDIIGDIISDTIVDGMKQWYENQTPNMVHPCTKHGIRKTVEAGSEPHGRRKRRSRRNW